MKPRRRHSCPSSFTLVEMLVAMAILALMLALMFNLLQLTMTASRMEKSRIDNFTRARALLDVIAGDIEGGVFRPDLAAFGTNNGVSSTNGISFMTNGSALTAFYTRNPGLQANSRNLSLVIYRLDGSTNAFFRRDQLSVPWTVPGTSWTGNIPFQGELASDANSTTAQEIAGGVVGFQLYFCRSDQSITNRYSGYQAANPVIAVGVALAVVDSQSLNLLNTTGKLNSLTQTLSSSSVISGTNSVKAEWDIYMNSPGFFQANPTPLGVGIETFERKVTCNPPF
jgi:prepilin-type N-terminal cleavage/methylation domain-containing protein